MAFKSCVLSRFRVLVTLIVSPIEQKKKEKVEIYIFEKRRTRVWAKEYREEQDDTCVCMCVCVCVGGGGGGRESKVQYSRFSLCTRRGGGGGGLKVQLNKLTEEKVGVTGHFEILFSKKQLFPIAIHTKTDMLFGQHFHGESPRNLNHVFLRQFENGFNKKIGMFMFKNQNAGTTLTDGARGLPVPSRDRALQSGAD